MNKVMIMTIFNLPESVFIVKLVHILSSMDEESTGKMYCLRLEQLAARPCSPFYAHTAMEGSVSQKIVNCGHRRATSIWLATCVYLLLIDAIISASAT